VHNSPLLLRLFILLPTPHTAKISTSALRTTGHTAASTLHATHRTVTVATKRSATLIVLSTSLGPVDTFLGCHVADGLEEAALADLAADEIVDAVLELVDLIDAGNFGLVELFCKELLVELLSGSQANGAW
jgi:hypothetical protein